MFVTVEHDGKTRSLAHRPPSGRKGYAEGNRLREVKMGGHVLSLRPGYSRICGWKGGDAAAVRP